MISRGLRDLKIIDCTFVFALIMYMKNVKLASGDRVERRDRKWVEESFMSFLKTNAQKHLEFACIFKTNYSLLCAAGNKDRTSHVRKY